MAKAALDNATKYQDILQVIKRNYSISSKYGFLLTTQAYTKYQTLFKKPLARHYMDEVKDKATRFIVNAKNYDELIETFQYLPSIEINSIYKGALKNLVELVGIKPFPVELTILAYRSDYSLKLSINYLKISTRILLDLEEFNKPDYTIVKQLKMVYDKDYDTYYHTTLLEEVTELKTNLEAIHKRNKS